MSQNRTMSRAIRPVHATPLRRVTLALPADDLEKPRAPNLAVDDGQAGAPIDRVGSNHALPPIRGNPVDLHLRVFVNVPCLNLIDDNIITISLSAILRRAVPRPAATEKSARGPSRSDVRLYGVATVRPPWAQGAFRVEQVQVLEVVDGPVDGDVHEHPPAPTMLGQRCVHGADAVH